MPPILFNVAIDQDIGERTPIDPASDPAASAALAQIHAALSTHLATVEMVPNQMIDAKNCRDVTAAPSCVGGNNLALAVCKDPLSREKYPTLANCTSNPEYFGTEQCREQQHSLRHQCMAKCMPSGEQ